MRNRAAFARRRVRRHRWRRAKRSRVWIRQVPSRGVGSRSRKGWIGGLTTQRLDLRVPQDWLVLLVRW